MTILFAGTPENAAITLRELVAAGVPITLVLTRPDAPIGRKAILTPSPVAVTAEELGIACIKTGKVNDQVIEAISLHNIDFAIVVAFGVLLKPPALKALPRGWFNLHYSILPRWRGAAPVQWSIINGDRDSGVTLFKIDEGLDTGDLVSTAPTQIQPGETAGELLSRLTHLGVSLLLECLPQIESGLLTLTKQDESEATLAPKLARRDGHIDFELPVEAVGARAQGVTPEPGAWFETTVGQLKVLRLKVVGMGVPLNQIQLVNEKVYVGAIGGSIELIEVQPAGKRPMLARDWFRGVRQVEVQVVP